jgi:D-aminoacyl-tRNA deacylase
MRVVIQRVKEARVEVEGRVSGAIGPGLTILLAIAKTDSKKDADYLLDKILNLRIFPDIETGKMNRSIRDIKGSLLVISQFTLYGDCRKGRRPSFDLAAGPQLASELYEYFVYQARRSEISVETGIFQALMQVHLVNDGPVTLICETDATSEAAARQL